MFLKNDRLIKALFRQPVDATPVWLMRQAGRYLPEYRALREKAKNFLTLCKTPELACEITLQPLKRFPLDAAIIFSDILVIPDAMGLGLHFIEGEGPCFEKPIQTLEDIQKLHVPSMADLNYVFKAIAHTKAELAGQVPLIGFCGSPWTLACYMIEGGASKTFAQIKRLMFNHPSALHHLLNLLSTASAHYLNAQIAAGADAVMIFDTWGGVLSSQDYQTFSLAYMTKIVQQLNCHLENRQIPVILFTKNGGQWLEMIATSGCDAIGLDWMTDIAQARQRVGNKVALQGNLDPATLYATPERIREEVQTVLQGYGPGPGHVFNLGHGIFPDVPFEHVAVLVDAVHNHNKNF